MNNLQAATVTNPMTPEQSKAQVVDAAHELVHALGLHVVKAVFWHSSCNDDGDPPFRGRMMITYPPAASYEASESEIASMVQRLQSVGWAGDSNFHSHGSVLKKNNVVATFYPGTADKNPGIDLLGECRDVTTTKQTRGSTQEVNLG
ncbi:hypothetical protein [Mycobacterium celatum]|uniref:Uncharacterized protein n=1 Tax=Mycobacterium celatum TaxID=28045 RepID=A0A1X1RQE1_MYCCE|nr:hypothetical protein [Mycobacterium celatum]ORV12524.1 hypothetical protein AWB95_12710 [Mycobacterium celatum]PIB74598.1 hypothetical protein CQY23_21270 [Mycobacterium celatum]